jgi:hypothetical protein
MLRAEAVETIGVDPTPALIERAQSLDPQGDYRIGRAEDLEFADDGVGRSGLNPQPLLPMPTSGQGKSSPL